MSPSTDEYSETQLVTPDSLSQSLEDKRAALRSNLRQVEREVASQNVLASREHPFCIFPLDYLIDTYRNLL